MLSILTCIVLDTLTTIYCIRVFGAIGINALDSVLSPIIRFFGNGIQAVILAKLLVGSLCIIALMVLSRFDYMIESCNIMAIGLALMGIVAGANNIS